MNNISFYTLSVIFEACCMLMSSFFAIKIIRHKCISTDIRKFTLYSFIATFSIMFAFLNSYLKIAGKHTYGILHNSSLIIHFAFLTFFISKFLANKKLSNIVFFIFIVLLLMILLFLFTNDLSQQQSKAFAVSNFGLVIFCFFYYYQLFESMPRINLLSEPSFWIVNGIFFSMCATIPVLLLRSFLTDTISADFYSIVVAIIPFSYGIMHLFFIKAYLCSMSQSKAL